MLINKIEQAKKEAKITCPDCFGRGMIIARAIECYDNEDVEIDMVQCPECMGERFIKLKVYRQRFSRESWVMHQCALNGNIEMTAAYLFLKYPNKTIRQAIGEMANDGWFLQYWDVNEDRGYFRNISYIFLTSKPKRKKRWWNLLWEHVKHVDMKMMHL